MSDERQMEAHDECTWQWSQQTYLSCIPLDICGYKGDKGEIMELQNTVFQYICISSLLTWIEIVAAKWKINFYFSISCNGWTAVLDRGQ